MRIIAGTSWKAIGVAAAGWIAAWLLASIVGVWSSLPAVANAESGGPGCSASVILGDRVGIVRIGMPMDSLRSRCRVIRDTSETNEGDEQHVVYALVGGDTLRIEAERNVVWRLSVRRPGFATRDSIRVGTPLSRFLIGRRPTLDVGGGKVYVFDARHPGNGFGLSNEAFARVPKLTAAGLTRLPPSTIIDEILVTGTSAGPPHER